MVLHLIEGGFVKAQTVMHETAAEGITEKFDALFPAWPTVVATIIAVLILLLVLTKLLYKPVKKMHDDRRDYIQSNIDSSEKKNKESVSDREKANDELIQARLEAAEIINQAKVEAEHVRIDKIALADREAIKVVEDARSNMAAQQAKFEEESKEAIIGVALEAASKVIEKEVDNKVNRKIVEDFIKAKK